MTRTITGKYFVDITVSHTFPAQFLKMKSKSCWEKLEKP